MRFKDNGEVRDIRALWFENNELVMMDQRLLPQKVVFLRYKEHTEVAKAIRDMVTRGAPSIGAAAAYGMTLAALNGVDLSAAATALKAARPTANDLFYAVDHMAERISCGDDPVRVADSYASAIIDNCTAIGVHGAPLIRDGYTVMTHCNAGALATVDVGTALAPIRAAWSEGRRFKVLVSETRPRLQGLQLTAWELVQEDIDHAVIVDGASGHFMRKGVDMVIVGADRIVANGDFANKVGTYEKAVIAKELGVPFYVAAPVSTFDFETAGGDEIDIEERDGDEISTIAGASVAPAGVQVLNPAFDVTPARYVTAYITEKGILRAEDIDTMRRE